MNALLANGRLTALLIGLIVVAGLAGLAAVPRQEDPTLTPRVATVVVPFPGADAERVEALVTDPMERRLREVAEIKTLSTTSADGIAAINVELKDGVRDPEPAFSRIRDAIADAEARLPPGAGKPVFDDKRFDAYTLIAAVVWSGKGAENPILLHRHAEELENRLRGLPGTRTVRVFGAPEEEIRVTLDTTLAAASGLTAADVAARLAAADVKVAAGLTHGPASSVLVEVDGALNALERVRSVPMSRSSDGRIMRLGEIARVERGISQPRDSLARVDGRPAILIGARMEPGRRVDQWAPGARRMIAAFGEALPLGVQAQVVFDQAGYTDARFADLIDNLLAGCGIVVATLFLTMGWRSAVLVSLALPLTSLLALAMMWLLKLPIHQISVTGMVVALGLLVDNAIVMTDGIRRRLARGTPPLLAARETVGELGLPLTAATITTVLAFIPIMILPGPAGEFVGGIGIAVSCALIGSLALALTVTPALAARWLRPGRRDVVGPRREWLPARLFRGSIAIAVRFPRLAIMATMIPPALGFLAAGTLTEQFFPPSDRDQFHIQVFLPRGASIEATTATMERAQSVLASTEGVAAVQWVVGDSAPNFYYNMKMSQDGSDHFAEALVTATSPEAARRLLHDLRGPLERRLPEAQILMRELNQGPPFDAPLEIRLYGPDLDVLRELGERVRSIMATVPGVTQTQASLAGGVPKLVFDADEDAARLAGLSLADIARAMDAAFSGAVGGSVLEGTESLPVRVRVSDAGRSGPDAVRGLQIPVRGADGGVRLLPLAALGDFRLVPTPPAITRRDGERVNLIYGFIEPGMLPASALKTLRQRLDEAGFVVPAGTRLQIGGESEGRDQAVGNLAASIGLIVTLLLATLVMTFSSFRLAAVVLLVAGQAMGLGLLSVWAFGYPLGFVVLVALLGLIGLAINAAIIILSEIRIDPAALRREPDAIVRVVLAQSRHILSTTLSTVGGFLPLVLASGGFWPPFAVAIAGGTLLTTLLSFYFVPAAFRLVGAPRRSAEPVAETAPA